MPAGEETEGSRTDRARQIHEEATVVPGLGSGTGSAQPATPGAGADLREFSRALIEVGLIDEAELESYAADSAEGVLGLSRALVKAGKLTPYQAAAVYQKKSRGLLVGNYVILDKLGQGGMGVVFKARHRRLGRVGALKILPPSFARDHQAVMRFRREVEAAGRLKHPNVVAAVDADEDRGVHFLVMDYVEGQDLDHIVRERGPMKSAQALDCLIQAARGLEAAHAQGIIHRDIKPANLMLDDAGTVRILDLGLARLVDAANPFGKAAGARLTESGMYMGTIDFMAPEQAEDSHRVDRRADVYSLGCTLYYLLIGRVPFDGATVLKRLMAHMEKPAPSLRAQRPDVPASLEAVYLKMMAKRPAERPASMTELILLLEASKADASATALTGESPRSKPELMVFNEAHLKRPAPPRPDREPSIFARPKEAEGLAINHDLNLEDLIMDVRPDPRPEPLLRPTKRTTRPSQPLNRPGHPAVLRRTLRNGTLVAVLIAGLTWFVTTRGDHRAPEPSTAEGSPQANLPDRGTIQTRDQTTGSSGESVKPFEDELRTIFDGSSAAGWMLSKGKNPLPPSHVQKDGLNPHGTGSYLVVYHEKLSDFELDFDYKLEKGCNSGVFLRVSDLADPVNTGIEVALDDTTAHGLGDSGALYSLVAPEMNAQYPAGQWNHMTITAQGPEISVVLNGSPVSNINLDEWTTPGKRPDGSDHKFRNIAVANLARIGYVGFQDLQGNCWFNHIRLRKLSPGGVSSPRTFATTKPAPPSAPVHAAEPYVETARFVGHAHPWVECVRELLPDGSRLLSSNADGTARLWDVATGRELRRLWHPATTRTVAPLPDGRRAITGCDDGAVRLWDLQSGRLIRTLVQHSGPVHAVAVSTDGTRALSGGDDKTLRILNVDSGGVIKLFEGITGPIWSTAFTPDGRRVVAGDQNGAVYLGDAMTSDPLGRLEGHSDRVWEIAVTSDGRLAVSAGQDRRLICWDLVARRQLHQLELHDDYVRCVALGTDDRYAIFGTQRGSTDTHEVGSIGTWDITTDGPPQSLAAGPAHLALALLPGGRVATADIDGLVRIWERSAAIARARELSRTGHRADALLDYDNAVASHPSDPRLLIERGRLLLALGQTAKAASDLEHAAALAPDAPQLFLDAPWWAAGPYPIDYSQASALENATATDPSQSAPHSGSTTLKWHEISPALQGHVNFEELFKADDVVAYAMTVVYSTRPREAAFLIGADDTARIWLNGREVFSSNRYSPRDGNAILVTLLHGRNTIVARVRDFTAEHGFSLRFGESPADLARAYAHAGRPKEASEFFNKAMALDPDLSDRPTLEQLAESMAQVERWKEAKLAFEKLTALDPGNFDKQQALAKCYLALGDQPAYVRVCNSAIAQYRNKFLNPNLANNVIWLVALMPNAVRSYAEIVDIGSNLVKGRNPDPNSFNTFGAVLYRAGLYPSSLSYLRRSIHSQKGEGNPWDWVFTAMALHKSKQYGDRDALAKAKAIVEKSPPSWWQHRVELKALFKEAEELLKTSPPR
jgi:serine/threonine protein kinase/tetratricopeptide (TPR) repeat protein